MDEHLFHQMSLDHFYNQELPSMIINLAIGILDLFCILPAIYSNFLGDKEINHALTSLVLSMRISYLLAPAIDEACHE